MSLLVWITTGVVAGLLAHLLARHYGPVEDVIVGIVGAVAAGWAFVLLTDARITAVSPYDVASALAGAVALIALARGLTQGRSAI